MRLSVRTRWSQLVLVLPVGEIANSSLSVSICRNFKVKCYLVSNYLLETCILYFLSIQCYDWIMIAWRGAHAVIKRRVYLMKNIVKSIRNLASWFMQFRIVKENNSWLLSNRKFMSSLTLQIKWQYDIHILERRSLTCFPYPRSDATGWTASVSWLIRIRNTGLLV